MNYLSKTLSMLCLFLVGCGDGSSDATTPPSTKETLEIKLERIDISAAPIKTQGVSALTLANGNTQRFVAIGHYSDRSSKVLTDLSVWQSSSENVGDFIRPGELLGKSLGDLTVTASKDGVVSNALSINVTNAQITSITITSSPSVLAKGQTQPLEATAIYSDGSSTDVSDSVSWMSNDSDIALVSPAGLLSALDVGRAEISATKDGITSNTVSIDVTAAVLTAITVTPATITLAKGQTQQLEAMAIYSDNSSSNVSASVTWLSNEVSTAAVTKTGLLSAEEVGSTTLTATKDGITSNTVSIDVTAAVLTAITVTPATVALAKGQTQQLEAMAIYSDNSSSNVSASVTWLSNEVSTATVTPTGLLSGLEVGSTTLTATKDGVTSNTVSIDVTAAVLTAITVTPATVALAKGQTQQLEAMAIYSDNSSSNVSGSVTWLSNEVSTATVTPTGLLSAEEVGSTTLTATKDGITSNTVSIDVTAAVLTAITVTPATVALAKGQTQQLEAMAIYSDNSSSNVSGSVTWLSNEVSTATVTPTGLLSAEEVGSTTLTATKDGITSNTVSIDVTAAVITAINVTPSPISVAKGQTQQLEAMASYSDNSSSNVSDSVTWLSNEVSTATVTLMGLLSAEEVGSTTLTATKDGVTSNTVNIEVTAAEITSIDISPSSVSVTKGQTQQLEAMATYSDSSRVKISDSVTWISDDTSKVTVSQSGLLSGVEVASTTVTAHKDGITSNTINVEVTECRSTGSSCIDVFDSGSGVLFTNTPSKTFLDDLGGSANSGFTQEIFSKGPSGDFYWFTWSEANELCATYNTKTLSGRINWRLPTRNELSNLYNSEGNMFSARGWAVRIHYWSSTGQGPGYQIFSLADARGGMTMPDNEYYVSCISQP